MKSGAAMLLPLLRSRSQGDIIAWLMLHADHQASLTEIAHEVGVSPATVMREVDRLVDAGLVEEERRGNLRLVRATTDHPVYVPLARLMDVTFGPLPVLRELIEHVPGVAEAYIYGSWADRYLDVPGAVPNDVDVVVIGDADLDDLDDVAAQATRRLGREVNVRRLRPEIWRAADDPFVATIRSRRLVSLKEPEVSGCWAQDAALDVQG